MFRSISKSTNMANPKKPYSVTRNFAHYWCCFIYILQEFWLLLCILEVGQPHWISPKMNNIMGLFTLLAVSLVRYIPSHRVDRVLGFFSSRPNWDSTTPSPWPGRCVPLPPLWFREGGPHSLAGEVVGSQFGRGERHYGTLGRYMYFVDPVFQQSTCSYSTWLEFTAAIRGAGARSAPFFVFKSLKK